MLPSRIESVCCPQLAHATMGNAVLNRLHDFAPCDWLQVHKSRMPEPYAPVTVSNCLPAKFSAYCKLFHPVYVDPEIEDESISWDRWAKQHGILGSVLDAVDRIVPGRRILWNELAKRYRLSYQAELNEHSFTARFADRSWPRYLLGPDEGTLDREMCETLVSILDSIIEPQRCFFSYGGLSVRSLEPRLYEGDLRDVLGFLEPNDDLCSTPEYWWPEDRAWCVCTDWDLPFSLIGGPQLLIDQIVSDTVLEALHINASTRIDYRADVRNVTGERHQP